MNNENSELAIFNQEDRLIHSHQMHVEEMVDMIKEEMRILSEVDKPGASLEGYLKNLDEILVKNLESVSNLRHQISEFSFHLKNSNQHQIQMESQNEIFDIFELGNENKNNYIK